MRDPTHIGCTRTTLTDDQSARRDSADSRILVRKELVLAQARAALVSGLAARAGPREVAAEVAEAV
jgi:hypothetical protein